MDPRMLEPNSRKYKEQKAREVEKKNEKVVKGKVSVKKKSWWSSFITDDIGSIGTYVKDELLIPRIKSIIVDIITGSTERFFDVGPSRSSSTQTAYYKGATTNYNERYKKAKDEPSVKRSKFDLKDLIFENRSDAEDVKDQLEAMIEQYDTASVADLWDFVGKPEEAEFTDNNYGWTIGDIRDFKVHYTGNGYRLDLPTTRVLR
jgi:hypothetical protein